MKLLNVVCASATSLSGSAGETACVAHPASVVATSTPSALRRDGLSIILEIVILTPWKNLGCSRNEAYQETITRENLVADDAIP